ncbi:hypothetical protein [uncultured Gordonia sp.]|uniref:hypothetical protein n=1 Tax=uncultured Gordonia sp. TaxID=198437 RepID=UPI00258C7B19|nr:hypothetical protein [uncultured Gordonia sp.]
MSLQKTCDKLVRQWNAELVQARTDIADVVQAVGAKWETEFGGAREIPGQMFCTDVRGLLLHRREEREGKKYGRDAKGNLNFAPGRLTTRTGRGLSALIGDQCGWETRVRKVPSSVLDDERDRLVIGPVGDPNQLSLDEGLGKLERVPRDYDWFILWTLTPTADHMSSAFLAAVSGIDSSKEVIVYAATPLPIKIAKPDDFADGDDFNDYAGEEAEEGGRGDL